MTSLQTTIFFILLCNTGLVVSNVSFTMALSSLKTRVLELEQKAEK